MSKFRFKDFFTLICTLASIAASVIIVLTFLTTYHFINMHMFNSYLPLQIGICVTMMLWAIRFFLYRIGREKYMYSLICIIISIISLFFIVNLVK
ncbi:hypothetical protein UT300007_00370 [Clostridium sp. CTA-7]